MAPSPSDAGPSASLTPAEIAERDALTAYRGMWEDWIAIAATGDYQDPRLARHVSGEALSSIYKAVYANQRDGLVARGAPTYAGSVTAAEPAANPDRITIVDCSDGSSWLNYRADGQLEDNEPGGRHAIQALALKNSNTWKIDVLVIQEVGTC
ncbi:hypothetical protein FrEUN1fDRAFT_3412 [Parafrankia sp. EUN1f]|nr:hypothetical protein FrEUN1fDRAFT_3412 [Parafrankia sp. EUN1f]